MHIKRKKETHPALKALVINNRPEEDVLKDIKKISSLSNREYQIKIFSIYAEACLGARFEEVRRN